MPNLVSQSKARLKLCSKFQKKKDPAMLVNQLFKGSNKNCQMVLKKLNKKIHLTTEMFYDF